MVNIVGLLPLLLTAVLWALPFLEGVSERVKRLNNSLALLFFGAYVTRDERKMQERADLVRAARLNDMYRIYASKTILYSAYAALGGTIAGIYAFLFLIRLVNSPASIINELLPARLSSLTSGLTVSGFSSIELLIIFIVSASTVGAISGALTYYQRWYRPQQRADARALQIEESLPRTVAFMFALSRSGMSHQKVIDILVGNAQYFGGAAQEFLISNRDIDFSNADMLSATERLARTSPSDEFASFAEDLANVLRTGQSLPEYLFDEYEEYQEDKKTKQEQMLEEISALAEGYVALLVAGPLFLITLLVVIGLLIGGTLNIVRVFVYLIVPLTNLGFIYYLSRYASNLGIDTNMVEFDPDKAVIQGDNDTTDESPDSDQPLGDPEVETEIEPAAIPDGGTTVEQANFQRLMAYERLRSLRQTLRSPFTAAIRNPTLVLYPAGIVAFLYVTVRLYLDFTAGQISVRSTDDVFIQALLLVFASFATAQYFNSNRLERIERGLPDLIERLADSTGAGMAFSTALQRIDPKSIPELETEIRRIQRDIKIGTKTSIALKSLAQRAKSVLLIRAVVLITNANRASNNIAPVLRIAADEAQLDRRLKRRRRQDLFIYRMIIYMSFIIFLGIVAALILLFIPALPSELSTPSIGGGSVAGGAVPGGGLSGIGLGGIANANRAAYQLVLFHSAIVQAIFAGLVAGKMSEGTIRAGVKHATVMLAIGYAVSFII